MNPREIVKHDGRTIFLHSAGGAGHFYRLDTWSDTLTEETSYGPIGFDLHGLVVGALLGPGRPDQKPNGQRGVHRCRATRHNRLCRSWDRGSTVTPCSGKLPLADDWNVPTIVPTRRQNSASRANASLIG